MGSRGGGRRRRRGYGPTGFEEAGGYMAAKIAKLENQYKDSVTTEGEEEKKGLFSGIAIFVNGYTEPTAEELKRVMMVHGGTYHHYYSRTKTTHIIANNLPDTKVKNMNTGRIVSPRWITDSLSAGHLLDYTKYILYCNQSKSQPKLQFKAASAPNKSLEAAGNLETSRLKEHKSEHCQEICIPSVSDDLVAHHSSSSTSSDLKDTEAEDESDPTRHAVTISTSHSTTILHKSPVKSHAMSTANPRFLTEFYSNSRLHHISTMGALFKEYVNELQNKCNGFPGREELKKWMMNKDLPARGTDISKDSPQPSSLHVKNKRVIMHIDMDCFFVSVGLRKHPELRGKPVAVTHARGNPQGQARAGMDRQYELNYYKQRAEKKLKGKIQAVGSTGVTETNENSLHDDEDSEQTDRHLDKKFSTINLIDEMSSMSEIASCNYEARKTGVKNGMFLGPALKLCPGLKTIPYDFQGYKEVSYKLYDIVASFTHDIEAVSCDEMFVDLTELLQSCQVSPEDFTTYLRERVQAATGCPCSAGLGPNMLVARMATRHAKPNGQHWADPKDLPLYMKDYKVTELPGVGWSTGRQLEAKGLVTCGDLQRCSLTQLQALLGQRTGQSLYNFCRGVDSRAIKSEHVRKSVSAEVNYGIRFTCQNDAYRFISELAAEVESRLAAIKMKGKCITLKLKTRAKDAPKETAKFMGHGVCDNIAKSVSLNLATSSAEMIEREILVLLKQIKTPPQDFRGVGIQVSRLEVAYAAKSHGTSIKSFLLGAKRRTSEVRTSPAETLEKDDAPAAPEPSTSKSKNPEMTVVKDSNECQPSHHKYDTGQSSDAGDSQSDGYPPVPALNTTLSEEKSIDMDVLLALPEDMRIQVIAEYQQQGYIIPSLITSGQDSDISCKARPSEAQASTSSHFIPEARKRQETCMIGHSEAAISVPGTSIETAKGSSSELESCEAPGEDVLVNKQNAAVGGEPSGVNYVGDTLNFSSNLSTATEGAQNSALITSFSQVDSSFLEAIPEELREELRQDLEHLKQVREASAPFPGNRSLPGSPVKHENGRGRGRHSHRGSVGRRGRWSKTNPRRVEEGLVTLTTMMLGNTGKSGNFTIKKDIPGGKKRGIQTMSETLAPGSSPSKKLKEEKPGVNNSPELPAKVTNELLSSEQVKLEQALKTDVPDLCGMRELADVKSVIQAWVTSCAHPENEDADILGSYFTSLITHHDLEKLDCLIKYLYRQILCTHNKLWESAYQVVISQVQAAMVQVHGAKLKVKLFENS